MSSDVAAVHSVTAAAGEKRTLIWLAVGAATALALLLALVVLAVHRTRVSPAADGPDPARGPRHRGTPRPLPLPRRRRRRDREAEVPRRTATVRTGLHPQGYVELDHCLHRAEWTDSGTPPPAPGAPVDVTDPARADPEGASGPADVLLAVPCQHRPPTTDEHD
ncbi:hypothetical protein [Streptomyces dioscori]|nr:hypothetical protein [Streptomyces dioscori]